MSDENNGFMDSTEQFKASSASTKRKPKSKGPKMVHESRVGKSFYLKSKKMLV